MSVIPEVSVVSPAFNEESCLPLVIPVWAAFLRTQGCAFEILIVNDGSTDRTHAVLEALGREIAELRSLHSAVNQGYGAALQKGIRQAKGKWILLIDSDGQFNIEGFSEFKKTADLQSAHCVTGFRKKNDTWLRVMADSVFRILYRSLFGVSWRDPNCALKLCHAQSLKSLPCESRGFSLPSEILLRMHLASFKVLELPIEHLERQGGQSRLRFLPTAIKMFFFLFYLRLKLSLSRANIIYFNLPEEATGAGS